MMKKVYLSPLGYIVSIIQHILSFAHKPFMVYGYYNRTQNQFMKLTRISSSTKIISSKRLDIENNVWIGHYCLLDASNGIYIGRGVQTGPFVSIFTHSSHISVRLLGDKYLQSDERVGYIKGSVTIGEYTFIGTSSVIFPGVTIGKGCLIKAGSIITKSIPDFSIVTGNPAIVVGSTLDMDKKYFHNKIVQKNYFDKETIEKWMKNTRIFENENTLS